MRALPTLFRSPEVTAELLLFAYTDSQTVYGYTFFYKTGQYYALNTSLKLLFNKCELLSITLLKIN